MTAKGATNDTHKTLVVLDVDGRRHHFRPTNIIFFSAIFSGDYFCSFEAPEITASEIRGVYYGF